MAAIIRNFHNFPVYCCTCIWWWSFKNV